MLLLRFFLFAICLLFLMAMLEQLGSLMMFWDFTTFLMVPCLVVFVLATKHGANTFKLHSQEAMSKVSSDFSAVLLACTSFAFVSALITLTANYKEASFLMPGLAVSLLPLLYAAIFWIAFYILTPALKHSSAK